MSDTPVTSFTEFLPLALRTESHIPAVKTNMDLLIALLVANVAITEILDGMKKQVFYGDSNKLVNKKAEHLNALEAVIPLLKKSVEHLDDTVDIDPRVFHSIVGVVTESGELSNALLSAITGGSLDPVNISEEMFGDIGWYQAIGADALGINYYQSLDNVINKLRLRYPEKFTNELAANRDLDAEREALSVGIPQ